MKTLTLTIVSLKEFIRNWKSVLLLLVLPLLLITTFFISFSAAGLQDLPIGIINKADVGYDEINSQLSQVLLTKEFQDLDSCLNELKAYKQYVCIEIKKDVAYELDTHYDNTQTFVIWGIVNHIKNTVDYIKKQKTKEIAEKILDQANSGPAQIRTIKSNLNELDRKNVEYIELIDDSIYELESQKSSFEIKTKELQSKTSLHTNQIILGLEPIENNANALIAFGEPYNQYGYQIKTSTSLIRSNVYSYNNQMNVGLETLSLGFLDSSIDNLKSLRINLESNRINLQRAISNLNDLESYNNELKKISPDAVADPIKVNLIPAYLPNLEGKNMEDYTNGDLETLIKGENLLTFQIIFPKVLLLIVMFVSLLISSFISLNYIEGDPLIRLNTIKGMFFPSFFSIFFSTIIIVIIPILCVVLLGQYLFLLPFFENILEMLFIILASVIIYVLLGMLVAHLIRNRSLTLLITIFILIFLLLFSGFILPIERMARVPGTIASNFPGNIASDELNKVIFYNQPLYLLKTEIVIFLATLVILLCLFLLVKFWRGKIK